MSQSSKEMAIRDYYASFFDIKGLERVIDFKTFRTREFGFASSDNKFFRNISFEDPSALHDFLVDRTPLHAYVGAVYDNPPTRQSPIHTLGWLGHELVFDIDLNEYDAVRNYICTCQGADQLCNRCWQLITLAINIIDETLRLDFGMEDIVWVFSGRRGIHGWVTDSCGFNLTQEQRMSIIDYLTVIHGEEETARVEDRKDLPEDFRKRVEYNVFRAFLTDVKRKDLLNVGLTTSRASNIISLIKHQDGKIDEMVFREFNINLARSNKYDEILRRWVPRIDHKVTIDTRRLLRLPFSIHGKTGRIARILSTQEILNFNPEQEPSIYPNIVE